MPNEARNHATGRGFLVRTLLVLRLTRLDESNLEEIDQCLRTGRTWM
jgi:hypothetical protein